MGIIHVGFKILYFFPLIHQKIFKIGYKPVNTSYRHLQKAQIHAVLQHRPACLNAHEDLMVKKEKEKN